MPINNALGFDRARARGSGYVNQEKTQSDRRPRHMVISDILAGEIASDAYPVGSRFPTEQELQERFGVGRHTIREALKTLSDQGLLGRRRKIGTHVLARRPFAHYAHTLRDVRGLFDFAEDTALVIHRDGFVMPTEPMDGRGPAAAKERWLRVAGVRYVARDNQPLCWSEIFVPSRFPLDRAALRTRKGPIYEYCMETHGLKLDHVQQEIRAATLPDQIAKLLSAEPDSSALLVSRRYVDANAEVFEISMNLYPSDRYSVRSIIRQRS